MVDRPLIQGNKAMLQRINFTSVEREEAIFKIRSAHCSNLKLEIRLNKEIGE